MLSVIISLAVGLATPLEDGPSTGTYIDEDITLGTYRLRVKFDRAPQADPLTCLDTAPDWKFFERIPGKVSAVKDGVEITYYDRANYLTVKAAGTGRAHAERARSIGTEFIECLEPGDNAPTRI